MRIEDRDEKGEGYPVLESKEDLEVFRELLKDAYFELKSSK